MKYISTIISVLAIVLVGVVFFAQEREIKQLKKQADAPKPAGGTNFKIAYFDLDTLQAHYEYMKDVKNQAIDEENRINQELASLDRKNRAQVEEWQKKGNTM